MSQSIRGQVGRLGFLIGPKNTNLVESLSSCFLSSFIEFQSAVSEESGRGRKFLSLSEARAAILVFRLA